MKKDLIEKVYSLSPMQEGMLFETLLQPASSAYVQQMNFTLSGALDLEAFEKSFQALIDRYEIFRTVFIYEKVQRPKQVVLKQREAKFTYIDIRQQSDAERRETLLHLQEQDKSLGFHLFRDPLIRMTVIHCREEVYRVIWSFHHILMDGWCMGVVLDEFFQMYEQYRTKQPLMLSPVQPYQRYIQWVEEQAEEEALDYWRSYLDGYENMTGLPTTSDKSTMTALFKPAELCLPLSKQITERLTELAHKSQVTLNVCLQTIWALLLQRYNRTDDVVFGSVVSGRPAEIEGIEKMVGLFINTIPVRIQSAGEETFLDLVKKTQQGALQSEKYHYSSLAKLQKQQGQKVDVIQHIMVFENFPFEASEKTLSGLTISDIDIFEQTNYDLTIVVLPGEEMTITFDYNAHVYDANFMRRVGEHFLHTIETVIQHPEIKVSEIEIITEQEKQEMITRFGSTSVPYPKNKTIHELIEEQAQRTPERVAVVSGNQELTYQELITKANQVAFILREKGVRSNEIVGLLMEHSLETIIGILGILKSGAAYLPIDPEYPRERIDYMLADSQARVLLTHQKGVERHAYLCANEQKTIPELLFIEEILAQEIHQPVINNVNAPHDLIYLLYTSGSTGKPKGAMINHQGVVNYIWWANKSYVKGENVDFALYSSISFDLTVTSIFTPLLAGNKIRIYSGGNKELLIQQVLEENEVGIIKLTPSHLKLIKSMDVQGSRLKRMIVGGEALETELAREIVQHFNGNLEIYNEYGPTETVVGCMIYRYDPLKDQRFEVPIGMPADNVQIYLLDQHLHLVPQGIAGEICIAGDGVARGYLNQAEKTAESFINLELAGKGKMYRTGDLARILPDGNIEYLGRLDHQVKIRGYRIELGEITYQLIQHPLIEDAIVLTHHELGSAPALVAYFVPKEEELQQSAETDQPESHSSLRVSALREFLAQALPDYMIPSYFVAMEKLPLNANGKVERKQLPHPKESISTGKAYIAPQSEIEVILANIWKEVLGVEQLSVEDHFFELGGDSIKALQILSRLQKYDLKLDLKDLFTHSTIRQLSPFVRKKKEPSGAKRQQEWITGRVQLTPIQHWFFEQEFTDAHHWNQGVMLQSREVLHEAHLHKVFTKLLAHHDALRMTYSEEGEIHQFNQGLNHIGYTLEVVDCRQEFPSQEESEEQERMYLEQEATRLQESINLQKGPLVRVGLFRTLEADYLLVAVHHLVVDAVSWRILLEDLNQAYLQAKQGEEILFQDKTTSYKEWAEKLVHYANSPATLRYLPYWKQVESSSVVSLPKASTVENLQMQDSERYELEWSQEETEQLLRAVHQAYRTQTQDVLLSALVLTLYEWTKQPHVAVQLEGHGREALFEDVDLYRTVGWFTTQYPVVFNLPITDQAEEKAQEATTPREVNLEVHLGELLKSVKERLRQIPEKGIHYGLLRYLTEEKHKAGVSFELEPEINFNYLGEFSESATSQTGEQADAGAILEMSSLPTGAQVSPRAERTHVLDINALVMHGKLHMMWNVHPQEIDRQTMDWLLQTYRTNLQLLMSHCLSKQETERTPSDVGCTEVSLSEWKEIQQQLPDSKIEKLYALSPMQEGMFFHYLYDRQTTMYIEQTVLTLEGELNLEYFRQSLQHLSQRHDVCRTAFLYEGLTKPMQAVLADREIAFHYEEMKELSQQKVTEYVEAYRQQEQVRGFDLLHDPLIRVTVLAESTERYHVLWTFHHILMDGWCMGIILQELIESYQALMNKTIAQLEPVTPYHNYIDFLQHYNAEEAAHYWQEFLEDYTELATLPKNLVTKSAETSSQEELIFTIDSELTSQLARLARSKHVTLNTVIQTIWGIVLQRYNLSNDVVFGAVVSGRPHELAGVEKMVGLFINTIPVRVRSELNQSFEDLLQQVQEQAIESKPFHYYPLYEIQAQKEQRQNLIDHILVFENYPVNNEQLEKLCGEEVGFTLALQHAIEQTNYDFEMVVVPNKELTINFRYNAQVYDKSMMLELEQNMKQVILEVSKNTNIKVDQVNLLSPLSQDKLLNQFNATDAFYPSSRTIHSFFEEVAERAPEQVAVVEGQNQLTYRELNERANQLAHKLREKGVTRNSIVGLMLERSIDMMIGILAILKAGGAYLPLQPSYPIDRLRYMVENSEAKLILTTYSLERKFELETELMTVDQKFETKRTNPDPVNEPNDLAYIIYTSGTTGNPKGVMIEHRSVINRLHWMQKEYSLTKDDVILQKTPFSFDVSVWELLWWAMYGAKMCILPPNAEKDPAEIIKAIDDYQVTTIHFVPSMFTLFLSEFDMNGSTLSCRSLRTIFTSGEALNVHQVQKFKELFNEHQVELVNLYGPTEATIDVTYYAIDKQEEHRLIPIGKPIDNTQILILDKHRQLQPIGVAGELCIAGDGLARGYVNQPELTNHSFVDHPFIEGKKMYKTGDLARWLADGQIEYLGRLDHQMKIRGYRIEAAEVENRILEHASVNECLVTDYEEGSGTRVLVAYIVVEQEEEELIPEIRSWLTTVLPEYMIPSFFVLLEKMPLSPNGKIDRRRLPSPIVQTLNSADYAAPRNKIEQKILEMWKKIVNTEQIGIHDDFFLLGGHSLKATSLVSQLKKEFKVEFTVKDVFTYPTIEQMAARVAQAKEIELTRILKVEERSYYPVSSAQKRLYVLSKFEDASIQYNMPGVMVLEGKIEVEKVKDAFLQLLQRHESLRTSFDTVDGKIVQMIHKEVNIPFQVIDLQHNKETIDSCLHSFVQPFDLHAAPLFRVAVAKEEEELHYLLFDMHHTISDGVSMDLLVKEFMELYQGRALEPLPIQYRDYAVWQQAFLEKEECQHQESYWLQSLSGELPILDLPFDYSRPAYQTMEGDNVRLSLPAALTEKLKSFARAQNMTMYMICLAAYNILLSRYTNQEDLIIGSPISGRREADVQSLIGVFINTLALRNQPKKTLSIIDFLQEVTENTLQSHEHQEYPFERLIEKLKISRYISRHPLIDTMFDYQYADGTTLRLSGLDIRPYEYKTKVAKFDLSLDLYESDQTIQCEFEYATQLFRHETIERMAQHYVRIVEEMVENPTQLIGEIEIVTEAEKRQMVVEYNSARLPLHETSSKAFHLWIEEQAERNPDGVAVRVEQEWITYSALNKRANQLARILRQHDVRPNHIVAVLAERSIEMVIGVLAVLKAGGAYLPIDPSYPEQRIQHMIDDSQVSILLTHRQLEKRIVFKGTILQMVHPTVDQEATHNLTSVNSLDDLAYVIYTSGTTGKPKGVMIEHRNLVNIALAWRTEYNLGTMKVKLLQVASFSFDVFTGDLARTLFNGGELVICPEQNRMEPSKLYQILKDDQVTIFESTPALIIPLMKYVYQNQLPTELKIVILGSDQCSLSDYRELVHRFGKQMRILNSYGVTEACIDSSYYEASYEELRRLRTVPIGKPLQNVAFYVLNSAQKLQPVGVPGELYIGGAGVARGYFQRQELTEERFVSSPFVQGERLYKTGDMVRWLADGNLEFIGREDAQVNIRGYRVELAEIEYHLAQYIGIEEVVVLLKENKHKSMSLCTYYTANYEIEGSKVRGFLSKSLPEYMIPNHYIHLEQIPLTVNGKVDRSRLPEPAESRKRQEDFKQPRTEMEKILAQVWQAVLLIDHEIGLTDHFFDLGGDSIKAIEIVARLNTHKLKLEVVDLFQHPILEEVASYVTKNDLEVDQGAVTGETALTPIQHWFFEEEFYEAHHWNQSIMLYRAEGFDERLLQKVFDKLLAHHDALRAVFRKENGQWHQVVRGIEETNLQITVNRLDSDTLEMNQHDLQSKIEEEATRIQSSMVLDQGPLLKVGLFRTPAGDHLLMTVHHLVMDGISWRILLEDFSSAYQQELQGLDVQLPPKTHSYQYWAEQLRVYSASRAVQREWEYWQKVDQTPIAPLPKDFSVTHRLVGNKASLSYQFTVEETEQLLKQVNKAYQTEINDILLTTLGLAVSEWSSDSQVVIQLEGHGREKISKQLDISRTIGWFTSEYPVVLDMSHKIDLGYQIKTIKEQLRRVPNKGVGYGVLKYLAMEDTSKRELSSKPSISFNYFGQFDRESEYDLFQISDMPAGEMISAKNEQPYALEINAMITEKQLTVMVDYDQHEFLEETIQSFIDLFSSHMTQLMTHCLEKDQTELTPADVGNHQLSIKDLDKIQQKLKQKLTLSFKNKR